MRVLQLGLGAVGRENIRQLLGKRHAVVAIVDRPEVIDGFDPGDFAFADAPPPTLSSDLAACLAATRPDVVLQATTFEPGDMLEVVRAVAQARADLVSINGIVDIQTDIVLGVIDPAPADEPAASQSSDQRDNEPVSGAR